MAITGITGTVAVIVSPRATSTARADHVPAPRRSAERPRPHLTSATDVRTTALHRAHLEGPDRVACASCHDLDRNEFHAPPTKTCVGCHVGHEPAVHGTSPEAGCLTCHDFLLPSDAGTWARACESCHETARGAHPAIDVHRKQECVKCHAVHPRKETKRAECLGCHDTRQTGHPAGGSGIKVCMACHLPHQPARAAEQQCVGCHADHRGALVGGHERCVQCHASHTFTKATVKTCRDCHAGKHVLAADKVAPHAQCTSCHDPHAPLAAPAARCTQCHEQIAASSKHPHDHAGGDCVGCHPPHQALATSQVVVDCTERCHADKQAPGMGHGTAACRDCHPRHGFIPSQTAPALCLGCHARPIGRAPAIATSDGHARCTNCHRSAAHQPAAPKPACGSCHDVEAATAPAGHALCVKCHDVHTGQRLATAARCENCHADRTHTPHVRVAGGCQTCHRPHGPKGPEARPACSQCHDAGKLPGLHRVAKHQTCTACHSAHAPAITGRAPCLRCHTDREQHEPGAKLCQACHTFGDKP